LKRGQTELSLSNEWMTDPKTFRRWHALYRFDIDAAAAKWNAQLPRFWTKKENGLKQPSNGLRVWCNPPYSRGNLAKWVDHAVDEVRFEGALLWGLHVPAYTSEGWWAWNVTTPAVPTRMDQLHWKFFAHGYRRDWNSVFVLDVWFYIGRQRHVHRSGSSGSARHASAFVVFGRPAAMPSLRQIERIAA
jgi:hypothetical protein